MTITNLLLIHANVKGNYRYDISGNKTLLQNGIIANIDTNTTQFIEVDNDDSATNILNKISANSSIVLGNITKLGLVFDNTSQGRVKDANGNIIAGSEHNNGSRLPFLEIDTTDNIIENTQQVLSTDTKETYWNDPNEIIKDITKYSPIYSSNRTRNVHGIQQLETIGTNISSETINTSNKFFSNAFTEFLQLNFTGLQEIDIISCRVHDNINIENLPTRINTVRYTFNYLGNANYTTVTRHSNGDNITTTINGSWNLDKSFSKTDNTKNFQSYNTNTLNMVVVEGRATTTKSTGLTYALIDDVTTTRYFTSAITNYPYLLAIPGPVVSNITTPDDLYNLMASTNVVDMAASYTVANSIDMSTIDVTWPAISIGNSGAAPFLGQFNGQNNLITIGLVAGANLYFGLFGRVGNTINNGTLIQNINLSKTKGGYSIVINNAALEQRVGVLCGYLQVGTIQNCNVTVESATSFTLNATQQNSASTFGNYVGGLIGFARGAGITPLKAIVTNCNIIYAATITGAITISSDKRGTSNSNVGGLIGYALCADITNCILTSNITGLFNITSTCTVEAGAARIGGMFGAIDGIGAIGTHTSVTGCNGRYTGNVILTSAVASGSIISGGYCGFTRGNGTFFSQINNSSITYSSNLTVANTNAANGSIIEFGGITGRNQFSTMTNTNITVNGNTGITSTNAGVNNATTGGLCGTMLQNPTNAVISNSTCSFNRLAMYINSTNNNTGLQGGLVGYNVLSKIDQCNIIVNGILNIESYNNSNNTSMTGYNGGMCGRLENGILTNCTGTINNNNTAISSYTMSGTGFAYAGGMIGFNFANTSVSNNTLTYNSNYLTIKGDTPAGAQFVGGIVGNNDFNAQLLQCNVNVNSILCLIQSETTSLDHFIGGIAGSNFTGSQINSCNLIIEGTTNIYSKSLTVSVTCRTGGLIGVNENTVGSHIITNSSVLFKGTTTISSLSGNTSNVNRSLYTGGIAGLNILGCDITLSRITCNSTAIIKSETTSTINPTFIGGIVGLNRDNDSNINGCDATYNGNTTLLSSAASSTTATSLVGGIAGSNEDGAVINNCNAIYNSTTTLTATNPYATIVGGIVGTIIGNNTITNNTVKYNGVGNALNTTTLFTSTLLTLNSAYIGLLFGQIVDPSNINTNTSTFKNYFKINVTPGSQGVRIYDLVASGLPIDNTNTTTFETFPMIFNTTTNGTKLVAENGNIYDMPLSGLLTIEDIYYNIDYSNLILIFYLRIPVPISIEAPCCQANLCTANPQTTDKDASIATAKPGNLTMVTSVNNFYEGVSTGRRTAHSQPVFSSYQAYMQYLQGQNRR